MTTMDVAPTDPSLDMATSGGCGDSQFWAVDASDTIAIVASVDTSGRPFDTTARTGRATPRTVSTPLSSQLTLAATQAR